MIKKFENYHSIELKDAGLTFGENVNISNDVILYNPQNIIIGNNVRIDSQCILIAGKNTKIIIGNNVHISAGCYFYGNSGNITLEDYTCTSARCILYTSNDDYTDGYATNSVVNGSIKKVTTGDIYIKKHSVIGCNSVILPNIVLEHATSVGSHSLIKKNTEPFDIVAGSPAKFIKKRKNIYLSPPQKV
ncbi:acyltransferase [Candidatus Poribacteria bacterium]|nr:acyltransferase [Candidatus Poribacteria bacterium]